MTPQQMTDTEVFAQMRRRGLARVGEVTWRRSDAQLCRALRRMRDDGLLLSPTRGRFQRATAAQDP